MVMRAMFMLAICFGLCGVAAAQDGVPADSKGTDAAPKTEAPRAPEAPEVARFTVRQGYEVTVALDRLDGARFMEIGPDGTLYISRPHAGDIVECRDGDGDGVYERMRQVLDEHGSVQAMQWHDGWLWFATSTQVWKTRSTGEGAREVVPVLMDLPGGSGHWWRSLLVTDTHLYTSVGDSGNITDEPDSDRQKVWRYTLTGSDKTLWCSGIRNTEKLRFRPGTTEIWGVDHGSDWFGEKYGESNEKGMPITDLNPPDELNRYEQGKFYGHPFVAGNRVPRIEFREREDLIEIAGRTTPPEWCFGAHWAANSFTFVDPALNAKTGAFPADHAGDMFVACRGSWNRSEPAGYQVARVVFDKDPVLGGHPCGLQSIVSTLTKNEAGEFEALARPVDCVQAQDGSILFTSDAPVGRVYRIRWKGGGK